MTDNRKRIILIVDDNPANLGVLFDSLRGQGFKVLVAENGEDAIKRLNYTKPDIILLDVMMPGIDGFETCRRIKANRKTEHIPIIFMTSRSDTVDKVVGLELGAVDYVTKPIQIEEVKARVNTHLRTHSVHQNLKLQTKMYRRLLGHESAAKTKCLTFFCTDIERSTPLWDNHPDMMLPAKLLHDKILAELIGQYDGRILTDRGDGVMALFEDVNPLACAVAIQKQLSQEVWGEIDELCVRIGLHSVLTSEDKLHYFQQGEQYHGPALIQVTRIMDKGWGGQILASQAVKEALPLLPQASWQNFGQHQLKGLKEKIHIYGLVHPDLPYQFSSLRLV